MRLLVENLYEKRGVNDEEGYNKKITRMEISLTMHAKAMYQITYSIIDRRLYLHTHSVHCHGLFLNIITYTMYMLCDSRRHVKGKRR